MASGVSTHSPEGRFQFDWFTFLSDSAQWTALMNFRCGKSNLDNYSSNSPRGGWETPGRRRLESYGRNTRPVLLWIPKSGKTASGNWKFGFLTVIIKNRCKPVTYCDSIMSSSSLSAACLDFSSWWMSSLCFRSHSGQICCFWGSIIFCSCF